MNWQHTNDVKGREATLIMDDDNLSQKDIRQEIAELQNLLSKAEESVNDPEAEIVAKYFRELLAKRMSDNALH